MRVRQIARTFACVLCASSFILFYVDLLLRPSLPFFLNGRDPFLPRRQSTTFTFISLRQTIPIFPPVFGFRFQIHLLNFFSPFFSIFEVFDLRIYIDFGGRLIGNKIQDIPPRSNTRCPDLGLSTDSLQHSSSLQFRGPHSSRASRTPASCTTAITISITDVTNSSTCF